ncbi:MAG TPA: cell division protein FtsQ/DivIB [Methylophilaceae bacterium]|jgi:cell division protein FtsQ
MWNKPQVLNWIANFLFALAIVLLLYGLTYVVVHLPIFPLRHVRVDGQLTHVTREQVKLIVARHLTGNFFTVDLVTAREAFQKLPWARNVSVRRRWPDQLEVVVEEHKELARWGDIALVNTYGELFHAASDSDLPVFYGPGDGVREVAEHYGTYSKILSSADVQVAQLALSPRRAWEIKTDKGMVIELGREQMDQRLEKFASVYKTTLASLNVNVAYADLRYPNGFAVRKPEQATGKAPAKAPTNKATPAKTGSA